MQEKQDRPVARPQVQHMQCPQFRRHQLPIRRTQRLDRAGLAQARGDPKARHDDKSRDQQPQKDPNPSVANPALPTTPAD